MIMIPYFLSSLYYLKVAITKEGFDNAGSGELVKAKIFGLIGTIYGIWMLYSSGLELLLIASILYAPGIIIYALGKKEKGTKIFERKYEMVIAVVLIALAAVAAVMIATGKIVPF